jgi:CheY-like chemotaxis protein
MPEASDGRLGRLGRLDLDVVKVFRVLAVDDAKSILEEIERQLDPLGIDVIKAKTVAEACQVLEDRYVDAAIVDLLINGSEGGREVLRVMGSRAPVATAVIATAYTDHLGEYIGIESPHLTKIVHKSPETPGGWAAQALERAFQTWQTSEVRIENLELAVSLLRSRGERLATMRRGEELACEVDRLFRRLFGAATAENATTASDLTVELRPINTAGLSPAITVEATVRFGHDRARRIVDGIPVVLKIASRDSTKSEVERYHRFVKYGVPLLHRVEMLGHAVDQALGAVCYSFAGRVLGESLESLDQQLCMPDKTEHVRAAMDSLFGTPARSWYAVTGPPVSANQYVQSTYGVKFGSCQDQLDDAGKAIAKRFSSDVAYSPPGERDDGELTAGKAKLRIPRRTIWGEGIFLKALPTCLVHGDMHGGNVMVELDKEKLSRVCLIDYGNAGPGPRLTDFVALEASTRLRDVQSILADLGVESEEDLDNVGYRRAVMQAASRVEDERRMLAAAWDGASAQIPGEPWSLTLMQLSLLAHVNFRDLEEWEYVAVALPCAFRHLGFHVTQLARIRFAAWISALYERLAPDA